MTKFAGQQILGSAEWDGVSNTLQNYATPGKVLGDGVHLFNTGPSTVIIDELIFIAGDLTFVDPGADHNVGYELKYTIDGGDNYVDIITETAAADLPEIWDDTGNDTEDFAKGVPVYAFGWQLATPANTAGSRTFLVPKNASVRLRIATYTAGTLAVTVGLDNFVCQVTGRTN